MLSPGDRVWVHLGSGKGYVGVGRVLEGKTPVEEFKVVRDGVEVTLPELLSDFDFTPEDGDPDKASYAVRVEWLHKVGYMQGVWEKGFFAVTNTVARPVAPSWQYTVERLRTLWRLQG